MIKILKTRQEKDKNIEKEDDVQKKRGRPKKIEQEEPEASATNKKLKAKKVMIEIVEKEPIEEELILHIPLYDEEPNDDDAIIIENLGWGFYRDYDMIGRVHFNMFKEELGIN